ncbi:unnamed protein product, partial [Brachionus calyciflorus]
DDLIIFVGKPQIPGALDDGNEANNSFNTFAEVKLNSNVSLSSLSTRFLSIKSEHSWKVDFEDEEIVKKSIEHITKLIFIFSHFPIKPYWANWIR